MSAEPIDPEDGPWEADLCFTIKGPSKADVDRRMDRIIAAGRRVGVDHFSDYEGPQPEDGPDR